MFVESYSNLQHFFEVRPALKASMLLITMDHPERLDFSCFTNVLFKDRIGMVMLRSIKRRDVLINKIEQVCISSFCSTKYQIVCMLTMS